MLSEVTFILVVADRAWDWMFEHQLSETGPLTCLFFPITCNNHTLTFHVNALQFHMGVCANFCKLVCVCVCLCVITHAVISSKPPFTPGEMKGFPLSQSSFFVSMVLWFCQNPIENGGIGGWKKKINVPQHQQPPQPSRLPPCKYTHKHVQ